MNVLCPAERRLHVPYVMSLRSLGLPDSFSEIQCLLEWLRRIAAVQMPGDNIDAVPCTRCRIRLAHEGLRRVPARRLWYDDLGSDLIGCEGRSEVIAHEFCD